MSDKEKVSAVLSVILTAVIALLAVFGYHVVIVQPQFTAIEAPARAITIDNPAGLDLRIEPAAGGPTITIEPAPAEPAPAD